MLIAYDPIYETEKFDEKNVDKQPRLSVSVSAFGVLVTLNSEDFQLKFHDGKAENYMSRQLTPEQARKLGELLVKTSVKMLREHYISQTQDGVNYVTMSHTNEENK